MTHRLPPLNALRAFEAAARLGRMTAAAEELSVTPGAVSRQVQQLESSLGVALFEGPKSRPQLSAAGLRLLPALTAAFGQIDSAVREISDDGRGPLDVSCFSTFAVKWLIPRLFAFNTLHPDIEVRLRTTQVDIAQGGDLAITVDDGMARPHIASLPLFVEWLGPVLAPPLAARLGLREPGDLAGQALLHTRTRRNAWDMWCQSMGVALPGLHGGAGTEFEHYFFTLEAAVRGLGIAVAPWHLVMDDLAAGRLLAPLGFQRSGYRYVAQRRAGDGGRGQPRLDRFCDWLLAQPGFVPPPQYRAADGRPE
ncbi:LysR family transcriptional regulator [Comamonas humi]